MNKILLTSVAFSAMTRGILQIMGEGDFWGWTKLALGVWVFFWAIFTSRLCWVDLVKGDGGERKNKGKKM